MSQNLYRNVYWSRFFLILALIASILSLGGGGVLLVPFKSIPWLKTETTSFALYGSCPAEVIGDNWLYQDQSWVVNQEKCSLVFSNPNSETGNNELISNTQRPIHTFSCFCISSCDNDSCSVYHDRQNTYGWGDFYNHRDNHSSGQFNLFADNLSQRKIFIRTEQNLGISV